MAVARLLQNGNLLKISMCLVFAVINLSAAKGQQSNKAINFSIGELYFHPELDSNMFIENLSGKAYSDLIRRMFDVDQKYRDSVMKYRSLWANKEISDVPLNVRNYLKLGSLNDKANQKLLLRLVTAYGWPKSVSKNEEPGVAKKAWYIVWHAPKEVELKFYKFIKTAVDNHILGKYDYENLVYRKYSKSQSKLGKYGM